MVRSNGQVGRCWAAAVPADNGNMQLRGLDLRICFLCFQCISLLRALNERKAFNAALDARRPHAKKAFPAFQIRHRANSSVANGRFEDTEKTTDKVTAYGAAMIKRDQFYNEWTYDPASKSWQDEYGGRLEDPSFPRTGQLLTPDGKMWGMEFVEVWTNSAGEVQRKKPVGSQDWWQAFMPIWASSCGNITAGWPSRIWNRMQANASMVKLPSLAKYDEFFNKWTYDASQKAWFDEYGGKTFYDPKNIEIKPLVTSDGKEWRRGNRFAWVSGDGQVFLVKPDSSPDAKWKQVSAWFSSSDDVCLGWPSKELKKRLGSGPVLAKDVNASTDVDDAEVVLGATGQRTISNKTSSTRKQDSEKGEAILLLRSALEKLEEPAKRSSIFTLYRSATQTMVVTKSMPILFDQPIVRRAGASAPDSGTDSEATAAEQIDKALTEVAEVRVWAGREAVSQVNLVEASHSGFSGRGTIFRAFSRF